MGRWIDGLLPTVGVAVGLTAVGWLVSFGPIAEDVSGRTAAQLKAEGRGWAKVEIDGRDVTLTGEAPDPASLQLAVESADRIFGVRVVASQATVVPVAAPFTFSASRDGDRIVLSGSVPSEENRQALLAWAKTAMPKAVVDDRLTVARGAPTNFAAAAAFAVGQLGDLKKGTAELGADGYTVGGEPIDRASWRRLEEALKSAMPAGLKLAADRLVEPVPSPYRFSLSSTAGRSVAEGHLPDEATRKRVMAALAAGRPGGVVDHVEVAPGAPAGFGEAIVNILPGLTRLSDGGFELSGTALVVRGGVLTEAIGRQVVDRLKALLPAGFSLAGAGPSVLPPPPQVDAASCQAALAKVQTGEKILFEVGKADLDQRSIGVLDALVGGALACLSAHVTVEGHTDSDGDAAANQALSEARAAAVVDYLVAAGIARDRLTAVGYGATRPVAANDTAEGRQANRRIEFRVD